MYLKNFLENKEVVIKNINSLEEISTVKESKDDLAVIFCNITTTSLNPNKGDILRINLKLCYVTSDGHFSKIRKTVSFYEDPMREMSDEEIAFLDFSIEEKKGSKINWDLISSFFEKSDVIISHNSNFVKPWVSRYTKCKDTLWGCSLDNVNWKDLGFPGRNLETLSVFSGFFYDFKDSSQALDALVSCLSRNKKVFELIKNSKSSDLQIFAANAPIELKDVLKERKYRWNPDVKCWWLPLNDAEHGKKESDWLLENVPGTEPQIFEIDPKFRFAG